MFGRIDNTCSHSGRASDSLGPEAVGRAGVLSLLLGLVGLLPFGAIAQTDRIPAAIDPTQMVALRGNVHTSARPASDIGPADPGRTLNHISINFKPGPAQQAELDRLLADQQNPSSPNYHA